MKRLRIAIIGSSPCGQCSAACCKQNGHAFAAILSGDEQRRFAPFAQSVMLRRADGSLVNEFVLPYANGRCQFLGQDDRCTIYEDRPAACRAFECAPRFNLNGIGKHEIFLERNVTVRQLLESM